MEDTERKVKKFVSDLFLIIFFIIGILPIILTCIFGSLTNSNIDNYLSTVYVNQVINDTIYQDYKEEINLNDYFFVSTEDMKNMITQQDKDNVSHYKFDVNGERVNLVNNTKLTVYDDINLDSNGYYLINGVLCSKEFLMSTESAPDFIIKTNDFIKFSNDSKYDELKGSEHNKAKYALLIWVLIFIIQVLWFLFLLTFLEVRAEIRYRKKYYILKE